MVNWLPIMEMIMGKPNQQIRTTNNLDPRNNDLSLLVWYFPWILEFRWGDTESWWFMQCLQMPWLVFFTVAWGDYERPKLFLSCLICSSWRQRQLAVDKHYLHNEGALVITTKASHLTSLSPLISIRLIVCEAVVWSLVLEREWRSNSSTWSFDSANNELGGFERSVRTPVAGYWSAC